MRARLFKLTALLLVLAAVLGGCLTPEQSPSAPPPAPSDLSEPVSEPSEPVSDPTEAVSASSSGPSEAVSEPTEAADPDLPVYGESYYDVRNVVLYLETYGQLPPNYITKNEARALGWEGGSVERCREGAAIGGDRFGNYEGLLPDAPGRTWTECDIDTLGYGSRGARRLLFSNDGLYYYTSDHYESFRQVAVSGGDVTW